MPRYEDPSVDPEVEEAIINIKMAIRHIAVIWETTRSHDLAQAQADLEQAVRFLQGEERAE